MASALHIVQHFFPNVTRVTDADENVRLEVTSADDKVASKKDHNGCALAVACKRRFGLEGVIISRTTAYLVRLRSAIRYQLPPSTSREIVSFDRGAGFAPGVYQLNKIPKAVRLGTERGESTSNEKSHNGNLTKRFRHVTTGVRTVLGSKEE